VYQYLEAARREEGVRLGWSTITAFGAVAVICAVATVVPLRVGLRKMETFEF